MSGVAVLQCLVGKSQNLDRWSKTKLSDITKSRINVQFLMVGVDRTMS